MRSQQLPCRRYPEDSDALSAQPREVAVMTAVGSWAHCAACPRVVSVPVAPQSTDPWPAPRRPDRQRARG